MICAGAALLSACGQAPAPSRTAGLELGRWVTASGNLEVEIAPCDAALCGTVTKVLANRSMAEPGKEMAPVDPRTVLGLKVLSGFVPAGADEWQGEIYNRENGKTYRCIIAVAGPDELKVRPYVVLPLFGQTQIWRRVATAASR